MRRGSCRTFCIRLYCSQHDLEPVARAMAGSLPELCLALGRAVMRSDAGRGQGMVVLFQLTRQRRWERVVDTHLDCAGESSGRNRVKNWAQGGRRGRRRRKEALESRGMLDDVSCGRRCGKVPCCNRLQLETSTGISGVRSDSWRAVGLQMLPSFTLPAVEPRGRVTSRLRNRLSLESEVRL